MAATYNHWQELPFSEIWVVDTEFYPGSGLANGGREGDLPTPLCLVAHEMRSGRTIELWQDKLGPFPPYRLDASALFVAFANAAEFGVHLALGWGQPVNSIDCHVEFRHYTNNGALKSEDRPKGFYSLPGAVRYFGGDAIDMATKNDLRDRIMQGPPFGDRTKYLRYCAGDVDMLARLVPNIVPTIRSLPHALQRSKFVWATAQQERRGIPVDLPKLEQVRLHWEGIKVDLVTEMDRPYGCYEIDNGVAKWRNDLFVEYLGRNKLSWPRLESGALDLRAKTFSEAARSQPALDGLAELRSTLSQLRLTKLAVGRDGRNRTGLWPFGTKTGRNAPSASQYMFGPAKWIRSFITPPPGRALVHRDYSQQEAVIAAVLSGDPELLAACATGDVYLGIAKQLGLAPADATKHTHPDLRRQFKTVSLGIQYGLGAKSLSERIGVSLYEASEMLARLKARYRVWEDYAARMIDQAGLRLEIETCFGWRMRCPSGMRARTIRNFPIQSCAAEILHVACVLAERRGIEIVAPVHDALLAECAANDVADVSEALDRCMRDAGAIVLQGHELRTDKQIILPNEYYYEERGIKMWATVNRLVQQLEARTA